MVKKLLPMLVMLVAIFGIGTTGVQAQTPDFSDDFDNWKVPWDEPTDATLGDIDYSDGKLLITDEPDEYALTYVLNRRFSDFILDIDAKVLEGDGYRISTRMKDLDDGCNGYDFCFDTDGTYTVLNGKTTRARSLLTLRIRGT
ncbi:hypothetical protein FGU65_02630 [Methanoculleus sp. FWC-SCC1]|uniref:Uncharacterized protein n=1 Tax=Methanoculleus frigidifontis TaxID=2584085 RepID=A0ABT8M792_9EURY|nr:hypothetical protein [Methanoculleus sp. FWC-SCC1]MDN7023802.1 hypothetical protein [Methanoculleus sp. FWC-SCC1]